MNIDEFWTLVEQSRRHSGDDLDEQAEALSGLLEGHSTADLLSFQTHLVAASRAIDTWQHLAAGEIPLGGLSDDAFTDFRTWVIARGREAYERFLANPDTLVDLDEPWEAELFGGVAPELYDERVDGEPGDDGPVEVAEEMPLLEPDGEPTGDPNGWRDPVTARQRLPRLGQRYG